MEKMQPLVYFTGPPASGKTTLMAALTAGIPGINTQIGSLPVYRMAEGRVVEIGQRRLGGFSGTDALAMNIQPKAIASLAEIPAETLVLGEGDRLANAGFFQAVEDSPRPLYIVALHVDPEERARRAEARAGSGKQQNATWVQGRISKAKNLERWADLVLDSYDSVDNMLAILENAFDWAQELKAIRRATTVR